MTIHQKPEKSVVYHLDTIGGQVDGSGSTCRVYNTVIGLYKDGDRQTNLLMDPRLVFVPPLGQSPSKTPTPTHQLDPTTAMLDECGMCFMDTDLQTMIGNNLPYFGLFSIGRSYLRALAVSNASDVSFTVSYVDVSIQSNATSTDAPCSSPMPSRVGQSMPHTPRRIVHPSLVELLLSQHGHYVAILTTLSLVVAYKCLKRHMARSYARPILHPLASPRPKWRWVADGPPCVGAVCVSSTFGTVAGGMLGCLAWYLKTRLSVA